MSTDLQLYQPAGALADLSAEYGSFAALGLIGYDVADLSLPRLVVVNGANQMNEWDARGGQFHNTVTGDNLDSLEGYILGGGKGQYWSVDFNEAQRLKDAGQEVPVYCKSADGIKPDADIANPPCSSCRVCPKAKPTKNATGGWDAPECSNSRKLLFATWNPTTNDYDVAMLTVSKTGTKPVDDFLKGTFIAKHRPTFAAKVRFTTKKVSGNGNTWFVVEPSVIEDALPPAEHADLIREKLETYLPLLMKAQAEGFADDAAHPSPGAATPTTAADAYDGGPTLDAHAVDATPAPPQPEPTPDVDLDDPGLKDDLGF